MRIAVGAVDSLEALARGILLREGLDHAHPRDILGHAADHRRHPRAGLAERGPRMAREQRRRQYHQRQDGEAEQGQARAHREHHDDDAHQHHAAADQVDQPLRQQIVDHRDVVDHPRDRDADDVCVVVAQRQRLEVAEQPCAQRRQHLLPNPCEQVTLADRGQVDPHERAGCQQGDPAQAGRVAVGDVLVDRHLDQVGCGERQGRGDQRQRQRDGHAPPVWAHKAEQPHDDAPVEGTALGILAEALERATRAHARPARTDRKAHCFFQL